MLIKFQENIFSINSFSLFIFEFNRLIIIRKSLILVHINILISFPLFSFYIYKLLLKRWKFIFFSRTVDRLWSITEDLNILYKENWTRLAAHEVQQFQVNNFPIFLQEESNKITLKFTLSSDLKVWNTIPTNTLTKRILNIWSYCLPFRTIPFIRNYWSILHSPCK